MFTNIIKRIHFERHLITLNANKLTKKLSKNSNFCRHLSQRVESNETHFGFQSVSAEEKSKKVKEVFSSVADNYDLMNDVMSLGIHRYWKRQLIQHLNPLRETLLLDTCGGTGDVAFELVSHMREEHPNDHHFKVVVCDINENMLRVGQNRAKRLPESHSSRVEWVLGDAMNLPFEDNTFDAYTVAFGIRNVVHIDRALSEAHRVLKSGGQFLCLEFSEVRNPVMSRLYDWYSFEIIPVLGEIFAKDWNSYQYLVESIRRFPDQNDFKALIQTTGFTLVEVTNLLDGIAAIHSAFKK